MAFMRNGSGQAKDQARQAAKAGQAKPREPPFRAALNRKHGKSLQTCETVAAARPPGLRDAEGTWWSEEAVGPDAIGCQHHWQIDKTQQVERASQDDKLRRGDGSTENAPSQVRDAVTIMIWPVMNMTFGIVIAVGMDMASQLIMEMNGTVQRDRRLRH
jgi:hypothetical protein